MTQGTPKRRSLQDMSQLNYFFDQSPYVVQPQDEGDDANCNRDVDVDGTIDAINEERACGKGPVAFNFKTSDLQIYEDENGGARMIIMIRLNYASFFESETCQNLLDARGGLSVVRKGYSYSYTGWIS